MPALSDTLSPVDDDREYVVVITRLVVRNPLTALGLFRFLPKVQRQLRATDGLAHFGLKAVLLRMRFSTFAVFESRRALAAFMSSGAHGDAMKSLGGRFRSVEACTVTRRGAEVPTSWNEIHALLEATPRPPSTVAA